MTTTYSSSPNQDDTTTIPHLENLQPDYDAAQAFIKLFAPDGRVTFQTYGAADKILHGTLRECGAELTWENRQGNSIAFMVNEGDFQRRLNSNVVKVRAVFADFDGAPLPDNWPLEPSILVESSPGKYHAYWFTDDFPLDNSIFNQVQEAIAYAVGSQPDDVKGLARVMRLVGFYHCKREPFMTRLVEAYPERRYSYADICTAFAIPPAKNKNRGNEGADRDDSIGAIGIVSKMLGSFDINNDGRNNYGLKIACQIRDNRYTQEACIQAMREVYLPAVEDMKDPPYTDAEMLASIRQAYSRDPREPWQAQTFPLTDYGNAERLKEKYGGRFCYVKGLGYLHYDGTRWVPDKAAVTRYAVATVRDINLEVAKLYEKLSQTSDPAERDAIQREATALAKHAKASESKTRLDAMVDLAENIERVRVDISMFDQQDDLLNCPNGTVDLKTGILREHRSEDYLTQITAISYDPKATCLRWEQFQREICAVEGNDDAEMERYKQKLWGYTLTGETSEQVLMLAYGNGSNGKSTELAVIHNILDGYAKNAPFTTFQEKRQGDPTNDLAALRGARFIYASEGDAGAKLSESLAKSITGDAAITARHLYGEFFTYRPTGKVWLATNHLPIIKGQNNGIWRRLLPLDYAARFEGVSKDKNLLAILKAESTGILAWMVRGAVEWYQHGLGDAPGRVKGNHTAYKDSQDILGEFLGECFEHSPGDMVSKKDLQTAWNDWNMTYHYNLSAKAITSMLQERGVKLTKGKRDYEGLKKRIPAAEEYVPGWEAEPAREVS